MDDDDNDGPQTGNTAVLANEVSDSLADGSGFSVPAGTTVTSSSVVNGEVTLGVSALDAAIQQTFDGDVYGGASFTPLDATFDRYVSITIPTGTAQGTVEVYRLNSTVTSQAAWVFVTTGQAFEGKVTINVNRFGHYLCGMMTTETAPSAPTNLKASDGTHTDKIVLVWTKSTGATSYKVYRDTQGTAVTTLGNVDTWDDTGVTDNDPHTYWVKASNEVGDSDFSASDTGYVGVTASPPAAPTGVQASSGTYDWKIRVTWVKSAGATGYKIYRDNQTTVFETVGDVSEYLDLYVDPQHAQGGGHSISEVNDRDEHTYWIVAFNEAGDSGFSAPATGYVAEHGQGTGGSL